MREHGHDDGKTIDIVYRWADGDISRLPALAKELVGLNPDVIVAAASTANVALRQETTTIPIVGALVADPVKLGLADSYNQPGRNVTGVLVTVDGLAGKQAGLLLELIRNARLIAVLVNPGSVTSPIMARDVEAAIHGTPVKLVAVEVRTPNDLPAAFERLKQDRIDALVVPQDPLFFTAGDHFACRHCAAADDLRRSPACRAGRPDELRRQFSAELPPRGLFRRSHPEGFASRRFADRTGNQA
jgi:putative ABC transport system substrate-binding protein